MSSDISNEHAGILDVLKRWLDGEVVRLGGRACVFPHGLDAVRQMVKQHREAAR